MRRIAVTSVVLQHLFRAVTAAVVAAAASTTVAAPLPAQAAPTGYRFRILGVFDAATGAPVEGAEVTDLKSGTSALTTRTGTVSLIFLPDGGTLVRIRKVGYEPIAQFVSIAPADTTPITIMLDPAATRLPTVVTEDSATRHVSPGLRSFDERRRSGAGHFVTEAELRKSDNRKMQDVLRTVGGIQVLCSNSGPYVCKAVSLRAMSKLAVLGGRCTYTVYIDGMLSTDDDLNGMSVSDYGGIEAYAGAATIPVEYNATGNACGVLLFWTRER